MIAPPGSPSNDESRVVESASTKNLAAFLRKDRDRYAAALPTAQAHAVANTLMSNLQQGKRFISTFNGTSQYSIGGPSACGLASMNSVMQVLNSHRKGHRSLGILNMINRQEFHEVPSRNFSNERSIR